MTDSISKQTPPSQSRACLRSLVRSFGLPAAIFGAMLAAAPLAVAADLSVAKEYKIKAAFLYNFTKFVEWPPQQFETANSPIVIGVLGTNPFGEELELTVRDRKVNARPIKVVMLDSAEEAARVHVVFVEAEAAVRYEEFLRSKAAGVLTVGEGARAAQGGNVISFQTVGDKVRFEVDVTAAEERGLRVSAQLQKLATTVRR